MKIAGTDTSFIDGEGIAFVVYFQGCFHDCEGCHNPDLQPLNGGYEANVPIIDSLYDSVVLTGGEPLLQPAAVLAIAESTDLPVWLYTGFEYEDIPPVIRSKVDVIVCGKYEHAERTGSFPASGNQRVFRRGELANAVDIFRRV